MAIAFALLPHMKMPAQYDGRKVVDIPKERLSRLPTFPMDLSSFGKVNDRLLEAKRVFEGHVIGAETVVADGKKITMLDRWGKLHNATISDDGTIGLDQSYLGESQGTHIGLPGRPLGFAYDLGGDIIICDSVVGLIRWSPVSQTTELISNALADGTSLRYANDVAIGRDGSIYFTSASDQPVAFGTADEFGPAFYDTMTGAKLSFIYGKPTGRLLRWDPSTKETHLLLDGIFFANGVTLSPDESFVLVCETFGARVLRVWLNTGAACQLARRHRLTTASLTTHHLHRR